MPLIHMHHFLIALFIHVPFRQISQPILLAQVEENRVLVVVLLLLVQLCDGLWH